VILNPSVVALLGGSVASGALLLGGAAVGAGIRAGWDLQSGSERQLRLERRTVLVSLLVRVALALQLLLLFLLVFTADALAPQFTGAMCAAGSLRAAPYGYPALLTGLLAAFLSGLWLVLDHADGLGHDHPLLRVKYAALLPLAPLVLGQAALLALFLGGLKPEVVTSCCGSLFGEAGRGLGADLAGLPRGPVSAALVGAVGAAILSALLVRRTARGAPPSAVDAWSLAASAAAALPIGLAAVVSVLSPYLYELPTHHCPFCLLQAEYHFVGYPLYGSLLGGAVAGVAVGLLQPFRGRASLADALPALQRRLAGACAGLLGLFAALAAWMVAGSSLRM